MGVCPFLVCTPEDSRWKPNALTALGAHISDHPKPEWLDGGGKGYDEHYPPIEEWFAKLVKLYADVAEAYRRD